jgi:hypothetical protein
VDHNYENLMEKKLAVIYGFPRAVHGTFFCVCLNLQNMPLMYRKSTFYFLSSLHDLKDSVQCGDA